MAACVTRSCFNHLGICMRMALKNGNQQFMSNILATNCVQHVHRHKNSNFTSDYFSDVEKAEKSQSLSINIEQTELHRPTITEDFQIGTLTKSEVIDKYLHLYDNINEVHMIPVLPSKSSSLATYVNDSETLQNLVKLGADLSKIEKNHKAASHILKADFERDIKPYLVFLHAVGIDGDNLGSIITKNPDILLEDLDNLQVRVNYLESKKFSPDSISRIITKIPNVLSHTTKMLDISLGCLQKEFRLSGDEIRSIVTQCPRLILHKRHIFQDMRFNLEEIMGFTKKEMKELLLTYPKIYLTSVTQISERFDYLHNTMELSHECILQWPNVLNARLTIIKSRYLFLKHLNLNQLDPQKPNYISMKSLVSGVDAIFCKNVAKVPISDYNMFLKTM